MRWVTEWEQSDGSDLATTSETQAGAVRLEGRKVSCQIHG